MDELVMTLFSALSILGSILNIKKMNISFFIWTICNIFWIVWDVINGFTSRIIMDSFYLLTSIWGLISWTREDSKKQHQKTGG